MLNHKAELVAAVIQEFDLKKVGYLGNDESFPEVLGQLLGDHEIAGLPETEDGRPIEGTADVMYLDDWEGDPEAAIDTAMSLVRPGAFLMGSEYLHSNLPVMRAIEKKFNLMRIQVGPAGSWCIQKQVDLKEVA